MGMHISGNQPSGHLVNPAHATVGNSDQCKSHAAHAVRPAETPRSQRLASPPSYWQSLVLCSSQVPQATLRSPTTRSRSTALIAPCKAWPKVCLATKAKDHAIRNLPIDEAQRRRHSAMSGARVLLNTAHSHAANMQDAGKTRARRNKDSDFGGFPC